MMKLRLSLVAGAAALLASLSLVAGAGAAAKANHKAKHKCLVVANDQTSGKTTGYDYGADKCSAPYGTGLIFITYKQAVSGTGVTSAGTFKSYFNRGTIHGTYALAGTLPTTGGTITASGTAKILGGTGAFTGTRAKGKMTCSTNDAGAHYTCVVTF
jgi:hypothetical protein